MNQIPINEIFETVQGEATFTGTPAVFVRTQGCPVGCGWCDTKHTWTREDNMSIPIVDMIKKNIAKETYSNMTGDQILSEIKKFNAKHVVITGGEPALHDLKALTALLQQSGYRVQLETSGHFEPQVASGVFITCSPKMNMPGGSAQREWVAMATEIKWPVGKARDIENLKEMLSLCQYQGAVWLQPLSQSAKATELCVKEATLNDWRVSIQTHKYLGVR